MIVDFTGLAALVLFAALPAPAGAALAAFAGFAFAAGLAGVAFPAVFAGFVARVDAGFLVDAMLVSS